MKVCCIPLTNLSEEIKNSTSSFKEDFYKYIKDEDVKWIERSEAEIDFSYKQIIPYVLLERSDKKFACYIRHGTEKRLHGKISCGIGGHIDEPDKKSTLCETIKTGMLRELGEELQNFDESKIELKYLGIINEIESEVGLVHLGIVYSAKCIESYIPKPSDELKNMEWKTKEEIKILGKELWTELAFKLLL